MDEARAARQYEVNYKSKGWRSWGMGNQQNAQMMSIVKTDVAKGNVLTTKGRGGGKVLVKDLSTKKVVWQRPVAEDNVRSFMDSMINDLEQLTIGEFQAKWGIAAR
jgi:hypothetical protein